MDERPRQRHPLLLAAGELVREAAAEAGEADHLEQLVAPPAPFGARHPADAEGGNSTLSATDMWRNKA